jgi:hypothetical protein
MKHYIDPHGLVQASHTYICRQGFWRPWNSTTEEANNPVVTKDLKKKSTGP